jgi:ribosome modulation factor
LAGIVLGPNRHRWEQPTLIGNQILSVVAALALAWADVTPGQQAGVFAMFLMSAVLNWAAIAESARTKTLVIAGFCVWTLTFLFIGASLDADAKRGLIALGAGLNVYILDSLGGAAVIVVASFVYTKFRSTGPGDKTEPLSKAIREGDLAFRNARSEEINPYADADRQLSDAWISGYRKAAAGDQNVEPYPKK